MRFEVRGTRLTKPVTAHVTAPDEATAIAQATEQGVVVESCRFLDEGDAQPPTRAGDDSPDDAIEDLTALREELDNQIANGTLPLAYGTQQYKLEYVDIVRCAKWLRMLSVAMGSVACLVLAIALVSGVGCLASLASGPSFDTDRAMVVFCLACLSVIFLLAIAAALRMFASLGMAVRDIAINSHRPPPA